MTARLVAVAAQGKRDREALVAAQAVPVSSPSWVAAARPGNAHIFGGAGGATKHSRLRRARHHRHRAEEIALSIMAGWLAVQRAPATARKTAKGPT